MKKILTALSVAVMLITFTTPATAILHWESVQGQQISMDAYVILGTWWVNQDNPSGTDDDGDLNWFNYSDSRATATFTSGNLSGTYQLGFRNKFDENADVITRLIHGTWTINEDTSIQIGKAYAPWYFWGNSRAREDQALSAYGGPWDWFDPAFIIRYKGAFLELKDTITSDLGSGVETDAKFPRAYVGYDHSSDGLFVGGALGINTYEIDGNVNETVNAWVALLHANVKLTDTLSVLTAGHYGTNPDQLHFMTYEDVGSAVLSNGDIENTTAAAGFAEFNMAIGDNVARLGYGYRTLDNDTWAENDTGQTYYAQMEIPIHKEATGAAFYVYPEIAVFDEMDDNTGADEGKDTWIGAVWQINF